MKVKAAGIDRLVLAALSTITVLLVANVLLLLSGAFAEQQLDWLAGGWSFVWYFDLLLSAVAALLMLMLLARAPRTRAIAYAQAAQAQLLVSEQMLRDERNLLRTVLDSLPYDVFIKDAQGRYLNANLTYAHRHGCATVNDLVGKTMADLYVPETAARLREDDESVVRSGEPLLNRERRVVEANGRELWTLTSKAPFRDAAGRISGVIGIRQDISER